MDVRCPHCGKDFVKPVRREGLAEILARVLALHPFTCRLCAHRFWAWQWGAPEARDPDRRQYERLHVNFPLTFSTDTEQRNGTTLDLSLGGCAFKTEPAPPLSAIVRLRLHAPGLERPLVVDAAVVRSVRSVYVGAEFLRLHPQEQYRLTQFIAGVLTDRRLRDDAVSRAGRLREEDPVPQMR